MARYGLLRKLQVVHGTIAVSCTYLVSPGVLRFVSFGETKRLNEAVKRNIELLILE